MANKFGHVNPWWDIEQIKNLKFKLDTLKDTNLVQKYLSAGHSKDHIAIWNYFEPNPMPGDISIFYDYFPALKNIAVAINKLAPGMYLPLHQDFYQRYSTIYQVEDIKRIQRIIVMIEDACPGQIFQVGNHSLTNWLAGDWVSWQGDELHATYNLALKDRYVWQITGVVK